MRREDRGLRRRPTTERSLGVSTEGSDSEPLETRASTHDQHSYLLASRYSADRPRGCPACGVVAKAMRGWGDDAGFRDRAAMQWVGVRYRRGGARAAGRAGGCRCRDPRAPPFPKMLRDGLDDSKLLTRQQREG